MGPVCTLMVGRLDDWLKVVAEKQGNHRRSEDSRLGRRCRDEEGVRDLPRTGVSPEAALGSLPQPPPLERVHRRGRRDLPAIRMAEEVQRVRRRGGGPGWIGRWTR